jgi:hypothetical protein
MVDWGVVKAGAGVANAVAGSASMAKIAICRGVMLEDFLFEGFLFGLSTDNQTPLPGEALS